MQGPRILAEGVDGCILSGPMWPCAEGSQGAPDPTNTRYVSKLVSVKDEESGFLRIAERLLGAELSQKYLSKLQTECKPASKNSPPNPKHVGSLIKDQENIKKHSWPIDNSEQACGELKRKLVSGENSLTGKKLMIIAKYQMTVSGWIKKLNTKRIPFNKVIINIERAIPNFIFILQKLYQNPNEQLIHIDLHTGNIFVKFSPFEFGLADFGRCVFRRANDDPSETFFGKYLISYVSSIPFFSVYRQVPLEARLLSFCYMKKLENADPFFLVQSWENDNEVRATSSGSTDVIVFFRSFLISELFNKEKNRILFTAMIQAIQSICRKLRANVNSATALYNSLTPSEKKAMEFILTRYAILSPINSINEEIMSIYPEISFGQGTHVTNFLLKGILAPYIQDGSSLDAALTSVQGADLRILWADIIKGRS